MAGRSIVESETVSAICVKVGVATLRADFALEPRRAPCVGQFCVPTPGRQAAGAARQERRRFVLTSVGSTPLPGKLP
jgi:hypothetical protein